MNESLANDYGRSEEYTVAQVKAVLSKLGYTGDLEEVAIAIWCSEENSRALGLDQFKIKEYRGYSRSSGGAGIGTEGSCGGSFGGGD